MTSSTGTDPHPEVAEISDFSEGVLPPERTAQVRAHLADCQVCADVQVSLEEIRGLLGTLPGPARMPADIAGRIDAALAAKTFLDATAPTDPIEVSRETATGADAARVSRETRSPATTSSDADRPGGRARASTGPGRRPRVNRRWLTAALSTACLLAAIAVGGVMVRATESTGGDPSAKKTVAEKAAPGDGRPVFSPGRLPSHVRELLVKAEAKAAPSPKLGVESDSHTVPQGESPAVPPCVREGIGRSEAPITVERGSFHGTGAYLVVLPHVSDATRVDAYIVDSSCAGRSPQGAGDVLLRQTFERG